MENVFFMQKTAYERRISDWSSDVCSSDLMHVTPPQCAPDFVKNSPLAGAAGWVEVDQASLRHVRYPDIYSLGDAMSAPNAKTAAAARKQAPVVAENVLRDLGRSEEHTSELQSLMRISYAVFCLKKKKRT